MSGFGETLRQSGLAVVAFALSGCVFRQTSTSELEGQPVTASKGACIHPPEEPASITSARTEGTQVEYCIGTGDQCFRLDLASGVLERLATRPEPPPPRALDPRIAHVRTVNPELEVCAGEQCTALTPKVLPNAARLHAATTADGSIAVFLLGDAVHGRGYAEIWDVARAKKSATFRYARGDFRCGEVEILGETIYVSADTCGASPAARGALYTLKGRRLANVGGRDFGVFGNAHAQVEGTTWAFLEESGSQIAIHDLAKGKLLKTIDTSLVFKNDGAVMGNPGESALLRLADGKLAVVAGAPATGDVVTVNVATGELEVLRPPVCQGASRR